VEISFGSVDRAVVFGAEVTGLGFDLVEISCGSDAKIKSNPANKNQ
jgi:hypothetical protein